MRLLDRTGLNHNDLHHNNMLMRDGEPRCKMRKRVSLILMDKMIQNACETELKALLVFTLVFERAV